LVPTPAATDIFVHEHLIEGIDLSLLQGQVMSLSFSCLATLAGTYSVYLANNGRDRSYVANFTITAAQANTWVRVKIGGIPAFPTAGTWAYGEGVTGLYIGIVLALGAQWQTSNANQWISGLFAGTSSNINMLAVTNNQITITGIKLEAAAGPTYYQSISFVEEYPLMQRYYYTSFDYQSTSSGLGIMGVAPLANGSFFSWPFPRRMCKLPTITPYNASTFTSGTIYDQSTSAVIAITATIAGTLKGVNAGPTATGTAKGDVLQVLVRADARLS
jgi:hypothetical protein